MAIANTFNSYFTIIGPNLANQIQSSTTKTLRYYLNGKHNNVFNFQLINEETIYKTIDDMHTKASCGFDGISSRLVKSIKSVLTTSLTLITNQILTTGIFHDKLKTANVIPIYKKGDETLFCNYRPISILPAISKVIETIIYNQLDSFLKRHKLMYDSQYGFKTEHSTEFAALEMIDKILTRMDNKEIPINIYLELPKAFDPLDHSILIDKLEFYGVKGVALDLFKDYLINKKTVRRRRPIRYA